jgi:beta-alanine--pyruvate transaminase
MADDAADHQISLPHGYTYTGHPVACAAALAALDILEQDDMVERARRLAPVLEETLHSLANAPHVTDIRNVGLMGALQIAPRAGDPLVRPYEIGVRCWEAGLYVRWGGDTLQFAPPFVAEPDDIARMGDTLATVMPRVA